jgi:hypothetical protein
VAWDSNRPVPWRRLTREWLVYVAIMAVVFVVFFRDRNLVGIFAGLLISGPMYLAFGFALAKLGYQRKSLRELRSEPRKQRETPDDSATAAAARAKPAPTKRTGGTGTASRPGGARRKRH